jgi:hypothetical protein
MSHKEFAGLRFPRTNLGFEVFLQMPELPTVPALLAS